MEGNYIDQFLFWQSPVVTTNFFVVSNLNSKSKKKLVWWISCMCYRHWRDMHLKISCLQSNEVDFEIMPWYLEVSKFTLGHFEFKWEATLYYVSFSGISKGTEEYSKVAKVSRHRPPLLTKILNTRLIIRQRWLTRSVHLVDENPHFFRYWSVVQILSLQA